MPDRLRFQVGVEGEVVMAVLTPAWPVWHGVSVSVTACLPTKAPAYVVFDARTGRLYGATGTRWEPIRFIGRSGPRSFPDRLAGTFARKAVGLRL